MLQRIGVQELLVLDRGWPTRRCAAIIADAMIAALLPPGPPANQAAKRP